MFPSDKYALVRLKIMQNTIMNEWLLEDLINQSDVVYHLAAAVGVKAVRLRLRENRASAAGVMWGSSPVSAG